jgi:FkbM family methyltransferase
VIDIGANRGHFMREKVGFSGEIRAYEPNPACASALQALCDEDRRLTVHACAVTPTDGRVLLRIARSDKGSQMLPAADSRRTLAKAQEVSVGAEQLFSRMLSQ